MFRSANSHLKRSTLPVSSRHPFPFPSIETNAPVVKALGRIPPVPQLVPLYSLLERPALLRHLVVPAPLRVLNQDLDGVTSERVDDEETVGMKSVGESSGLLGWGKRSSGVRS